METKEALLELAKMVIIEQEVRNEAGLQPISDTLLNFAKKVINENEPAPVADAIQEELPQTPDNPNSKEWPDSSNISKTEYDVKERVLIVTFRGNGKRYAYHDFLEKDWQKVLKAPSIGKHINSEVKGVHASTPLDAPKPAPSKNDIADTEL